MLVRRCNLNTQVKRRADEIKQDHDKNAISALIEEFLEE
jgi:hypothetical protein